MDSEDCSGNVSTEEPGDSPARVDHDVESPASGDDAAGPSRIVDSEVELADPPARVDAAADPSARADAVADSAASADDGTDTPAEADHTAGPSSRVDSEAANHGAVDVEADGGCQTNEEPSDTPARTDGSTAPSSTFEAEIDVDCSMFTFEDWDMDIERKKKVEILEKLSLKNIEFGDWNI